MLHEQTVCVFLAIRVTTAAPCRIHRPIFCHLSTIMIFCILIKKLQNKKIIGIARPWVFETKWWIPRLCLISSKYHLFQNLLLCTQMLVVLKHSGFSRFCKEDPGYSRRFLQVIFCTFFFLSILQRRPRIFKECV